MNKFTLLLLTTLCLASCNQNSSNKTLTGKKFYAITADTQSTRRVMANTPITFETITISEEEFYFSSDSILIVTPTVVYVDINKEVFQIYLKQMESALSPREYRYSYKNGNLDIYEAGAQTITIEEHDDFYSTSTGETFHKQSIAGLTADEKRERIAKIITVKDDDMKTLLKSEMLLSDLVKQGDINLSNEVKTNNDKLLVDNKKIKEETDKIINANKNTDIYVRLHNDPVLYKIENGIWPDDIPIQTAFYITKNNDNQILAFTEIPYSQSGDWFMSMTHYFNAPGETVSTERINNVLHTDADYSVFKSGELYKRSLIKYFDPQFNLIDRTYKLTDSKDKDMVDPWGENMDIIGKYDDYANYTSLLKGEKLNFKMAKVYVNRDVGSFNEENIDVRYEEANPNIQADNSNENSDGQIFERVEIEPEPIDGMQIFLDWFNNNYRYPNEAMAANINGRLEVSFIVERDGSLTGFKITKDLGYGAGDAAVDVLKRSPRWSPGIQNGRPVRVTYILSINL